MRRVNGVSTLVDSCDGLIRQKVGRAYRRISPAHRRWIDEDDLLQEAVLVAFVTEHERYDPRRRERQAKFSTYLFKGLDWHLSRIATGLEYRKREAAIVELDAPVPHTEGLVVADTIGAAVAPYAYSSGAVTVHDKGVIGQRARPALSPEYLDTIKAFITLCRAVSDEAKAVMIRGFIFSDSRFATPEICAEIGDVAAKLHIGVNDLRLVGQDENLQKLLLTLIGRHVMLKEGTEEALRVLRCTECNGQFSIAAIREGRFFVASMTCRACMRDMQAAPSTRSCFGKVKQPGSEGYSPEDVECRLHCIDRAECKTFAKEKEMSAKEDEALEGVDLDEVENKAKEVSDKKKAKAEKKQGKAEKKPEKAEKKAPKKAKESGGSKSAEKEAELAAAEKKAGFAIAYGDVPKEVVKWPYRRGSQMLYVFMAMLAGVSKSKLKKDITVGNSGLKGVADMSLSQRVEAYGSLSEKQKALGEKSWQNVYKIMARHEHREHTWKLNEEGDQYKIYAVKYLGDAPKAAKGKTGKAAA